jgi:hypothetical protein
MNMNPDDHTLLLWLEDELADTEQMLVDAWAADQPLWLEKRESSRRWRAQMSNIMSHSTEIPQGEFFQARLLHAIATSSAVAASSTSTPSFWRKWTLPLSVAAAVVLGFLGGTQWTDRAHRAKTLVTYTPEEGVKAEFFETSPAEGTVIVLNGVEALPDEFVDTSTTALPPVDSLHSAAGKKETATLVTP